MRRRDQAAWAGDPSARDWIPAGRRNLIAGMAGLRSSGLYSGPAGRRRLGGRERAGVPPDALPRFLARRCSSNSSCRCAGPRWTCPAPGDHPDGHRRRDLGSAIWLYNNEQTKTWFAWGAVHRGARGALRRSRPDVSPGKNRWSTIQDFSFVKGIGESTYLEAIAEVEIYGRNTDWYGQTLKKDPSFRFFALASTNLTPDTYTGVRYRYETGGRETSSGETVATSAQPPTGGRTHAPDQRRQPDSVAVHPRPEGRERAAHAWRAAALRLRVLGIRIMRPGEYR